VARGQKDARDDGHRDLGPAVSLVDAQKHRANVEVPEGCAFPREVRDEDGRSAAEARPSCHVSARRVG
jgi:hypothetical protein